MLIANVSAHFLLDGKIDCFMFCSNYFPGLELELMDLFALLWPLENSCIFSDFGGFTVQFVRPF